MSYELIVDSFAGGGGASTGIYMATGRHPDIAINHNAEALAMHLANHPDSRHYCEDIFDVDPCEATQGQPVGLMHLSPDCTHFSKAKGAAPRSAKIRGLAWVAVKWADVASPRVITMENVEEIQGWGPLLENGQPDKSREGETFRDFTGQLRDRGYEVDWRTLAACDYGAPTIRKRLFLIARRDRRPIVWPSPTHGDPTSAAVLGGDLLPWRAASECIQWGLPCPSIFERRRPLVEASLRRIAKGMFKFVINNPNPFIVPGLSSFITEHANASWQRNMSINDPLRTVCAQVKGGHFAQVTALLQKYYGNGVIGSSVEDPLHTVTSVDHNGLVMANLIRQFGHSVGHGAGDPMGTVTAGGSGKTALVTSHLAKLYGTTTGQAVRDPIHTITGGGLHFAEVRAFLVKFYRDGGQDQSLGDPMHTITTKARMGLVTVAGEDYAITDIGMRMLQPRELFDAQGFPHDYIIDPFYNGKPMTKTAQVRMCGNSVAPPVMAAIVRANVPELALRQCAA